MYHVSCTIELSVSHFSGSQFPAYCIPYSSVQLIFLTSSVALRIMASKFLALVGVSLFDPETAL